MVTFIIKKKYFYLSLKLCELGIKEHTFTKKMVLKYLFPIALVILSINCQSNGNKNN